ncbi:POT family-domain-containing protein [Aspergillus navahoensis]
MLAPFAPLFPSEIAAARFYNDGDEEGPRKNMSNDINASPMAPLAVFIAVLDPVGSWLIATIELCERFAYFGITGPMQNYIQNSRNDPLHPGGIGLGQSYATSINQGFMYFGRLRTIIYSSTIYICGLATLFRSSLPIAQDRGASLSGLLLSLFLIGIGTGGIKTNVSSLIAEQYTGHGETIRVLKSGEIVAIDRDLTLQRFGYSLPFFLFINVGSFAALASTTIEQKYGFSAAFALPTVVFSIGFVVTWAGRNKYVSREPDSCIILNACQALWIAIKHKGSLDQARPIYHAEGDTVRRIPWDDSFIDDLKTATMETYGIPNDIMTNINPITTIILLPILDRAVFPYLRKLGVPVRHVDRITVGFLLSSLSMLYAAIIQRTIYTAPPCYDHPRSPDCMNGEVPNEVSVFLQAPAYVLLAISEILASIAGIEYAYAKAPKSMKSIIMAAYLLTVSVGVLIAAGVSPLTTTRS